MKKLHRHGASALCLLLAAALLSGLLLQAFATAADDYEETLLGELSKDFESGDPGAISSGEGDSGGKSYGAFQFASRYDGPKSFFNWCLASSNDSYTSIGKQLKEAYEAEPAGYDEHFDKTWKDIAKKSHDTFLHAQRDYVEVSYYQDAVQDLSEAFPGFDISNYSIALRNVILSRAVQHGSGGVVDMMGYVIDKLGGFKNQPETQLIQAIYEESGEVRDFDPQRDGESFMEGDTAVKYGIAGKTMSWFWACSSDVQLGVYTRLRINEPAKAQNMLATYGYTDAPLTEGVYQISPSGNSNLAVLVQDGGLELNAISTDKTQQFTLTYYASGYYTITNAESGLRLTAAEDGALSMKEPSADNAQLWKLESVNSGFSVQNRATEQYLSADNVSAGDKLKGGSEPVQWQVVKAGSAWTLTGASYPTYANKLQVDNSSFPFRGTLRCVDPIESVTVSILDSNGGNAISPASSGAINALSYDLSTLDNKVAFSRLGAGSYTLVISATSSGETDNTYQLESKFFVSDGTYLVTFDPNGGTASQSSMKVVAGQAYGTLPTAEKKGYFFTGWFTHPSGGTQITPNTITGAADQTLYAQYEKAYTYKFINYDDSVFASGTLHKGDAIPKPGSTPTRPADETHHYTFSGWEGYSDKMTISDNISFKAKFEAHEIGAPEKMTTDAYRITDDFLRAIPISTPLAAVQKNLVPNKYITIQKGSAVTDELAATGMTVEYKVNDKVLQKLTVVVTGDINGDGKCTITDMVQVQAHLLGRTKLTGAALQAADFSGDGKVTITDMVQATAVLLGKTGVTPN